MICYVTMLIKFFLFPLFTYIVLIYKVLAYTYNFVYNIEQFD